MFKNINWNAMVPVVIGGLIVGFAMWWFTKPDGVIAKFTGNNGSGE